MKTQLVIFGITGDLAGRKLLPALDSIVGTGEYNDLHIIGVSRRAIVPQELVSSYPQLVPMTTGFTMNLADSEEYLRLKAHLEESPADQTLFYLSVPPGAAADIVDFLGQQGLNGPRYSILFEKPFGFDLVSAQEFIQRTARYFNEDQLYRIDHYMAKEISHEILRIRREAVDADLQKPIKAVTIAAFEKIGIEGRAQFYEQTGALRDFVQGHLMQLLALVLTRKPTNEPLAVQRLTALQKVDAIHPLETTRAQYKGYQDEVQNQGSVVETFVDATVHSTDPEWQFVHIRLVTGKALNVKRSYIQFEYEDGSQRVLDEDEIIHAKGDQRLDAYERVLIEAIAGRKDIFTTSEEVLRSWEIVAPLQESWAMSNEDLLYYEPGANPEIIKKY